MSDVKVVQNEINSELDLILDDFEGQFDLIDFNKEKFLSIDYELIKNFDFYDSNSILTYVDMEGFDLKYDELIDSCQQYVEKYGISNTYISLGLIEFDGYLAPSILIPIFLEKNKNEYKIIINFNQEIQFNGILKFILDEENVNFPDFDGNVHEFIKQLEEVDVIVYYPEAYIGNFDLKFQQLLYDLNASKWDSIEDKYGLFKSNHDEFVKGEKDSLRINLQKNADSLGIKEDVLHLKSLLSMGNSVLVITDVHNRDEIKKSFKNDGFESLILELSENLSENDFYDNIANNEIILDSDIIELDNLVKKQDKYSKILDLINTNYSNLKISPKEIKTKKDNLLHKINALNITNYNLEIENVLNYDWKMYNKMENQIKEISIIGEHFFNMQNIFSLDYLNSDDFNNLVKISGSINRHFEYFEIQNKKLNEDYEIRIFNDLFSVNKIVNLVILDKNPVYIENNDIPLLNEYIKDYPNIDEPNENLEKYFKVEDDLINSIDINVRYTDLIADRIISCNSQDLILKDYENAMNLSKKLINVSKLILKEIKDIINFYNEFDFFKINSSLLNINSNFDSFKELILIFNDNIKELADFRQNYISFDELNDDVKKFIRLAFENNFDEEEIGLIFWFNIYNSMLNNFLSDYNFIDENKISNIYDKEFNEISNSLIYDTRQLLIQRIYSKSLQLNKNKNALIQKENLIKNFKKGKLDTIKNALSIYKDFIVANKRVYMIDIPLISQLLDNSYECHFDHVIITEDIDYELDKFSILLRSKNKLIVL